MNKSTSTRSFITTHNRDKANKLIRAAESALVSGKAVEALESKRQALSFIPDDVPAFLITIKVHRATDNLNDAAKLLQADGNLKDDHRPTRAVIVGRPRCGTPLTEHVLGRHSDTWTTGELPTFPKFKGRLCGSLLPSQDENHREVRNQMQLTENTSSNRDKANATYPPPLAGNLIRPLQSLFSPPLALKIKQRKTDDYTASKRRGSIQKSPKALGFRKAERSA